MKEELLFGISLFSNIFVYSQVGIGTNLPDQNSDLTLGSPNKGLIINKVTLSSTTDAVTLGTINSSKAGMIVYNTSTIGDVTPGFYVNDGLKWNKMLDLPTFNSLTSTFSSSGTVTNVSGVSPISVSSGTTTPVISLSDSGVSAGTYNQVTINPKGLVTAASNTPTTVSNTISSNTISTTVNGITGTSVNIPNIYTSDGTLSSSRTISQADNPLAFSSNSTTGTNHFSIDGTNTAGTAFSVNLSNDKIGIGTTNPQGILDITSNNSTLLLTRNSDPNANISSPVAGMIVYDSTNKTLRYYNGTQWSTIISSQVLTTANEGVVKMNSGAGASAIKPLFNFKTSGGIPLNIYQQIIYSNSPVINLVNNFSASPTTSWPENISSPLVSNIYNVTTNQFLENPIAGQVHTWRVIVNYSNKNNGAVAYVTVNLRNPLSSFSIDQTMVAPSGATSGNMVFYLITIADSASIGLGYTINIKSDTTLDATIDSITRISHAKD